MEKLEKAADLVEKPERPFCEPVLFLGMSAFTVAGWSGTFYPERMKSSGYLTYYASKFKAIEIDRTYYGTPSASTVTACHRKTPPDFVFAAKVPQSITHKKVLVDCEAEFGEFMETMDILGERLRQWVFQSPHFDRWKFSKQEDFLAVLTPFLKKLFRRPPA
jgi:uncharacterized protein YecE (DUF72 family)